jgi:hypothetical protein
MYIKHDIIFVNDSKDSVINQWCILCEYMLKNKSDHQSAKEHGCCEECWLTFGQMRQKEWKAGWRPDKGTLDRYKEKRRILITDIFKLLEE